MNLDYSSGAKPLWSQVADILRDKIKNNEYKVGESFPPEMQLIESFGVSRITMRQALDCLVNEGYIVRKRGKGTIVQKREDVSTSIKSSFVGLEENSVEAQKKLLEVKTVVANKELAEYFDVKENTEIILMTRGTQVNGKIIAIFNSYINPKTKIKLSDDFTGSFYELLRTKGFPVTAGKEEISATISNELDKKIFELQDKKAIITRKKYGFSDKMPVELTYTRYIADGYTIVIELN